MYEQNPSRASTDIDAKNLHGSKCYLLIPPLQPKITKQEREKKVWNPKSHGPCFPNPVLQAPNSVRSSGLMKGEVTNRGL
ncbi:unnamed protein product [Urochloa decumbens]|uniref:Uncharacterized protein n=1 Tax=Urochloa decumbens TaxID=240449 RepID=A0ABC8V791_9POAL